MEETTLELEGELAPGGFGAERDAGPAEVAAPSRRTMHVFALLALVGVVVAAELTRIHVFVHTDPSYHSICAVSEGVDCETVAVSPYSVFAGLPVSVWGLLGYLVMGGLALSAVGARRPHPTWPLGLLLALSAFSVAISASLAYVSATRIDSLCLFCMGSYAVNAGLFAVGLVALRRSRASVAGLVLADAKALAARPRLFAATALCGVAALGALYGFVPSYWGTPGWSDLPGLPTGVDGEGRHWIGARSPRLTIVEFSDYECPHCRAAHRAVRALAAEHPERVRLVHRHLPLDRACNPGLRRPFHQRSCLFAEAAECAGREGRFWEMNDALFSIQESVRVADVDPVDLAVRLGLDRSEFERCLRRHATAERVAVDVREGLARGLRGTPSFLVGGRLFLGRIPEEALEELVGAAQ